MLSRLSYAAHSLFDHGSPSTSSIVSLTEDDAIVVDLEALSLLPHYAWQRATESLYNQFAPLYHGIHEIVQEDIGRYTQVLLNLEDDNSYQNTNGDWQESSINERSSVAYTPEQLSIPNPHTASLKYDGTYAPRRKRRRSSPNTLHYREDSPLVIPSCHPSTPTIIITPCDTVPRQMSCCVPLQDSGFHNTRLTVPGHYVFNKWFPPLLPTPPSTVPSFCEEIDWEWYEGHWRAVLPDIDEQVVRSLFSRLYPLRKGRCPKRFRHRSTYTLDKIDNVTT